MLCFVVAVHVCFAFFLLPVVANSVLVHTVFVVVLVFVVVILVIVAVSCCCVSFCCCGHVSLFDVVV